MKEARMGPDTATFTYLLGLIMGEYIAKKAGARPAFFSFWSGTQGYLSFLSLSATLSARLASWYSSLSFSRIGRLLGSSAITFS